MSNSNYYFITQVLPHEDADDHEVVEKCGNLKIMHAPGEVQSYGALIGLKEPSLNMHYLSENTMKVFGLPYQELLGKHLSTLLGQAQFDALKMNLGSQNFKMINPVRVEINGRSIDLILHRRNGALLIEAEKVNPAAGGIDAYREMSQRAIMNILGTQTVPQLVQAAVDEIRAVTGYDRILFYVFDEQYHGKVIGESRVPDIESFLGSRFPAWETPGPVRELYRSNFTRYIPHVFDVPAKVISASGENTEGTLDMTNSVLRATRQCHIQYLTNMGVGSSLTFSMTMNGRLWGFIVCHKRKPMEIPYNNRLICEQVAGVIPDELWSREQPEKYKEKLFGLQKAVAENVKVAPNVASGLLGKHKEILELTGADGAAILFNNVLKVFGQGPTDDEARKIFALLAGDTSNLVFKQDTNGLMFTNNLVGYLQREGLGTQVEFAKQIKTHASGLLLIPITRSRKDFLVWFRPEQITVATWAGNPSKQTIFDDKYMHAPLNPRKSFESWKANVVNRSEAWLPMQVEAAVALRDSLLSM